MPDPLRFPLAMLALCALSTTASAACDDVGALLAKAYPAATARDADGFDVAGAYRQHVETGSVACRVWPADPALTLLAVPLVEKGTEHSDETRGDVEIIVARSTDGEPFARRVETNMACSDAMQFGVLTLDTARYDLRPGLRAFGLRTRQAGGSAVDPFSETSLWLYTFENGRVRRMLDGLIVEASSGENHGNCAGEQTTVRRTLSFSTPGREGYRDLVVDQNEVRETGVVVGSGCNATETPGSNLTGTIRFDGTQYAPLSRPRGDPVEIGKRWFSQIGMDEHDASSPAPADAAEPSFDCAKAGSKVEKLICTEPALAKADATVAKLYKKRRQALDPVASARLAKDQGEFLAVRDRVFEEGLGDPATLLHDLLTDRADFLGALRTSPANELLGRWRNFAGQITIAPSKNGSLGIDIAGAEPITARWICDGSATGRMIGGVLEGTVEEDGSTLRLRRKGGALEVAAVPPLDKPDWTPGYCGLNGTVEGTYFPVSPNRK